MEIQDRNKEMNDTSINNSLKGNLPLITLLCCTISVILFVGINLESNLEDWSVYNKWGYYDAIGIFKGNFWGLISSNFLHVEIWHIAFNLYWLWIFGKKIESESTKIFYGIFIISSSLVSSIAQLSFSDSTGIGLSGVVYAFFGYILIKSRTSEKFKNFLDKKIIVLFILWLFVCILLTYFKVLNIGNAAHFFGLLWGITLAYISNFNYIKQMVVGIIFCSILASSIFWNPFSTSYLNYLAHDLHERQLTDKAISIYEKILRRNKDSEFAKDNLEQLRIHKMQERAVEFHLSKNHTF